MLTCLFFTAPALVLCGAFGIVGIVDVIGQVRADQIMRRRQADQFRAGRLPATHDRKPAL